MAYFRCEKKAPIVVRGTGTKTTTATTKVTLGFRPSFVMMYNHNSTSGDVIHTVTWDSTRASVQVFSYQNQVSYAFPSTSANVLASIDDDGFTVNKSSAGTALPFSYIAIKE